MLAKRWQEKQRLLLAAQAQAILMQSSAKNGTPLNTGQKSAITNEVYEPEGKIDYTKYNNAKK